MNSIRFSKSKVAIGVAILTATVTSLAAEVDFAGGKLNIKGSVYYGEVTRAADRDPSLYFSGNAVPAGLSGGVALGRNQDDGNLNYAKGDVVSRALKGRVDLEFKKGDFGVVGGLTGWQDYAQKDSAVAWGNQPNGYAAGQPLSDNGFDSRAKFSGFELDNLYVFGHSTMGQTPVDWKAGQQRLDIGGGFTISGGLGDLSPRDLPARLRAGALPEDGSVPVTALTAKFALSSTTTVDGFVQAGFVSNVANGCGTFYSATDYLAPGCLKAMVGGANDYKANLPTANPATFVARAPDKATADIGAIGVTIHQKVVSLGGEVGIFLGQFESRAGYISAIKAPKSLATGGRPQYFIENPEGINILGLTFEKKLTAGDLRAEFTYKPNQPYQYNAIDLLTAFTSASPATPLRAGADATAPGASFDGYERHKAVQLNLGATTRLPGFLGAKGAFIGGEFAYKGVPDLPDPTIMRFRRSDVFGTAPINGATCATPANSIACSTNGYVSSSAAGLRARFGMMYPEVLPGVNLTPSISYLDDIQGWSEDNSISEGRKGAALSLKAVIHKSLVAELVWQHTWGGDYNNLRDRSTTAISVGYQF